MMSYRTAAENARLIEVKVKKFEHMPWYWMGLTSITYPGQFYREDEEAGYIIFSGIGLPENLAEIPNAINSALRSAGGSDSFNISNVRTIVEVPKDAAPLYKTLYREGVQNMQNARGRSLDAARRVESLIQQRYQALLAAVNKPNNIGEIILLERTAFQYFCMGNTVRNGDIGRATCYVSDVLLRDTTSETSQLMPDSEENNTFQILCFHSKQEQAADMNIVRNAAHLLTKEISNQLGSTVNIVQEADKINIIINTHPVSEEERSKMIFLETVRACLYMTALDDEYELVWTGSTANLPESIASKDNHTQNNPSRNSSSLFAHQQLPTLDKVFAECRLKEEWEQLEKPEDRDSLESLALAAKALRRAANANRINCVKVLLREYPAKKIVNHQDNNPDSRKTALHYAAEKGYTDMIELLKAHGACDTIPDAKFQIARDLLGLQATASASASPTGLSASQ
jgi:hypothetical protein